MKIASTALLVTVLAAGTGVPAQEVAPTLAARTQTMLERESNGHSPTPDEIASVASLTPAPSGSDVKAALPALLKALASTDVPVRTYALTLLAGLEVQPPSPAATATPPDASGSPGVGSEARQTKSSGEQESTVSVPAFHPDVAAVLAPAVPAIAAHLTEEEAADRILTATILGGFTPAPPAAVYSPLHSFLTRDDAITSVGLLVVGDLLQLGPVSETTAAAIARYFARADQNADSRASLVETMTSKPFQSRTLDAMLLRLLDSGDDSLRARIILSLPTLDLSPEAYAAARVRVQQLAESPGENLQVVNAAKAVTPCWAAVKMASGCPAYQ